MAGPVRRQYSLPTVVLGPQTFVNLDWTKIPFQASVLVDVQSGAASYGVEYTTDDIFGTADPNTLRWIPSSVLPYGTTATGEWTVNFPVMAVRLNIYSMTGVINLTVIQGISS